jgi:UDP-N-acetylglucosamine--N-acetylmuramyl-(pentapeptide) pyrophosphoryl-undecaprenol N-acetylglucosamine transferase
VRFLLAGGGTGGHVNPLLALAELLRDEGHEVIALGTKEGLEQRLVPERGFELATIPRLPLPRKLSIGALSFPFKLLGASLQVRKMIRERQIDGVVGFGGYASAPAYIGARLTKKPLVIHEANALAGFANRLGARFTRHRAVAFSNSNLTGATLVGMPIRREVIEGANKIDKDQARVELGLDPVLPTLLVTGGSQGARSINNAVIDSLSELSNAGIQVLHIVGEKAGLEEANQPGYLRIAYCDRMDAAIAASDLAISRSGASTVSEFSAAGLPAVFVPYPVGNGEQRHNAGSVVEAGGAELCDDKDFTPEFIAERVIPTLSHKATLKRMSEAAKSVGIVDAAERLRDLLYAAVDTGSHD